LGDGLVDRPHAVHEEIAEPLPLFWLWSAPPTAGAWHSGWSATNVPNVAPADPGRRPRTEAM
jgi:hypothetical protein